MNDRKKQGTQKRELNRYRLFYKIYPQIGESVTPQLKANLKLKELALLQTGETLFPQSKHPNDFVFKLSFSHLDLLVAIENNTKRAFYEVECIRGNWSVRELKRQINSLYYERSRSCHTTKRNFQSWQINVRNRQRQVW